MYMSSREIQSIREGKLKKYLSQFFTDEDKEFFSDKALNL